MKKILILLLLMVSTNVFAEWTLVSKSEDDIMTDYLDFKTIRRKGNKVNIWSLTDFKTVQTPIAGHEFLSAVQYLEYDCENETRRQLDAITYSGNMRRGGEIDSIRNAKVEAISIQPESGDHFIMNIICGKK